jgi:hypothetical protein
MWILEISTALFMINSIAVYGIPELSRPTLWRLGESTSIHLRN